MKLRTILTLVLGVVGLLAIGATVALIVLTSALHDAGARIATAVDRVRLVMELESTVLQRMEEPRRMDEANVSSILTQLRQGADAELIADVERLETMVDRLADGISDPRREVASVTAALRLVVAREELEASRALAEATRLNRTANTVGAATVLVLLGGLAGVTVWLWRYAFGPLIGVAAAIDHLGHGDRGALAPEEGPEELRKVAVAFNNMAESLGRQHEQQLAFIGGVAHDLRTPLNTMRLGAALLERQSSDPRRAAAIVRQIERMDRMINDLLDSTRIEAGRLEFTFQICDLREPVAHTVDGQQASAPDRSFVVSQPSQVVPVRCDVARIEQVLNNLVGNAVKYSPDTSEIEVTLRRDGASAVLSVRDHGVGIQAADQDRIFEPFSRGRNVGRVAGAGLGLSVTRRIVEAHGGDISVTSTPGVGSVFTVRLPIAPENLQAADARETVASLDHE
jgi:two-component system sensor histidine kinase MtrB